MELFIAVIAIIFVAFIVFCVYFIFKQIQFVLVSVNLYKKMVNRQDAIVMLLLDIRDKTKKYDSIGGSTNIVEEGVSTKDVVETANLQTSKIECPHCHKNEEIMKKNFKNPNEYTLFKASYNSFLGSINLVCNDCGTKFKIESQML